MAINRILSSFLSLLVNNRILFNLFILFTMSYDHFKCPKCHKFTRHIDVGMQGGLNADMRRDKSSSIGRKLFSNIFGGFNDSVGLTKVIGTIVGCGTYKCCECGMVAMWDKDGTMKEVIYWND